MNILAKQPNPLRFLLYLEWALLAIAIVTAYLQFSPHLPSLVAALLIIALLASMGLCLPSHSQFCKVLYTFVEICLLLVWEWLVPHSQWQLLDLVIVIRSYFLFGIPGQQLVTGLVFVLALVQNFLVHHLPASSWQTIQSSQLANLLLFGVTLLLGLQLSNFALVERQTRQQLQQSVQQMANFAALQQCNRQAWDFQYTLIYSLAAVNVQLQAALKLWQANPAQAQRFLVRAHQQGTTAMLELRRSVRRLAEVLDGVIIEK